MQDSRGELSRIDWIDLARGFCMVAILFDHTEIYYTGSNQIPYICYVENVLTTFFFLSGYLFINPQKPFSLRHKLFSVARGIIVPYFIFTSLIAFPKAMGHGQAFELWPTVAYICTGQASWFVATLVVMESTWALLTWLSPTSHMLKTWVATLGYAVVAAVCQLRYAGTSPPNGFWFWPTALFMLPFFALGEVYRRHQHRLEKLEGWSATMVLGTVYGLLKYMEMTAELELTIFPIHVSSFSLFLVDNVVGIMLIVNVCKKARPWRLLLFTGKHSLVYYFFCGGVPFTLSVLMNKVGFSFDGHHERTLVVVLMVWIVTSVMAFIIYRYLPWMVGKKKVST